MPVIKKSTRGIVSRDYKASKAMEARGDGFLPVGSTRAFWLGELKKYGLTSPQARRVVNRVARPSKGMRKHIRTQKAAQRRMHR